MGLKPAGSAFCIESSMRNFAGVVWICGFLLLAAIAAVAGTPGSFRGTIVDSPDATSGKNWIYVQGRNGTARRVEISHARVGYDEDVPAADRRSHPEDALTPGTEVRVTAEQGSDGEWRASRIEILKAAVSRQHSALSNQHSVISNQDQQAVLQYRLRHQFLHECCWLSAEC